MGDRLKALRKRNKLTQKEAADLLRVSLRSYKSYENDPQKEGSIKYQYMIDRLSALNPLDETHGILTIEDIREACQAVFSEYPVEFAYLFGSYAKNKAKEESDVDLLISTDLTGMRFYGLLDKIKAVLCKNVDLLTTEQLKDNVQMINEILRDGVKIYG